MIEKEIQFRKKRELGDILSDSFEFIKQEYKPISSLIITYVLPFLILYGIVQVFIQMKVIGVVDFSDPEKMLADIGPVYTNIFLFSLFGIFVQSLLIGTYYSYIEIYIKKGKGNFDLSEVKSLLFSNSLLALGAGFVVFILTMIGIVLCIVPGIYFANTFSILVMIVVFEKKGLSNAMSRSWNLVNSQWWNTLLINIIGIVIIWAAGFVLSLPAMITGISTSIIGVKDTGVLNYPNWYWIVTGISTIISSLLWIIPATFIAMQYYNLDECTKPENPFQQ
ncbi:MAG: hypothetical protein KAH68_03050 [Draconibacterium sp.]|nr:hypothetical protein [Draconibacterium sp.]